MRPRRPRLPKRYCCRYTHRGDRTPLTIYVYAWSKIDASVLADRELRALGKTPDEWWAYGPEIER